jgi:hypothetical protein
VLVLMCPIEEKEFLIEFRPEIYFETDHYKGWPAVLIRLSRISDAELKARLAIAWGMQAPKQRSARRARSAPSKKRSTLAEKPRGSPSPSPRGTRRARNRRSP